MPSTYVVGFHDEAKVKQMPYRLLGQSGLRVSALSFGKILLVETHVSTDFFVNSWRPWYYYLLWSSSDTIL